MYILKFYKQVSLTLFALVVATQVMAQPGKNGPLTVTAVGTIVNAYDALAANAAAGATSITATTIANLNNPTALAQGDLVMIIQMQGATMDVTNTAAYGTVTALNNAGRYEYAYVCSVAGNVINLTSALTNSYTAAGRAQIVRVPQYTTLTVNAGASITAPAWNGTTGGVVAIHANGVVTVNGTIQANAMGFRGGRIENNTSGAGAAVITTYFANDGGATGAEKGESIVGYGAEYDALGGRYNRGAPANGGGGGNGHNAGGGGGANGNNGVAYTGTGNPDVSGGAGWVSAWNLEVANFATSVSSGGGRGGYTYGASDQNAATLAPGAAAWGGDQRDNVGGFGGRPLTANSENRIFLGGGGGAGDGNNNANADGGDGGGIVYITAPSIAGTGTITANGQTAPNTIGGNNDAPGGGGAGGTIIIKSTVANTITVNANGGNGGNQLTIGAESEGPGGGGGGGFVAVAAGTPTITVAAGANGTTASTAVTEFIPNGATRGATGLSTTVTATFITSVPPTVVASSNTPVCVGSTLNLTSTITNGLAPFTYSWTGPVAFTSTAANPTRANMTAAMAGAYNVTITDAGGCTASATTTVVVNTLPVVSITGANPICVGATTTLSPTTGGTWASSNAAVATVTNAGTVTGVSGGTATFTFTETATGCTSLATPAVTVNALPVVSITGANPICVGSTTALSPTTGGTWASSNAAVATVTNAGVVTGVAGGTATFTFTNTATGCTSAATPAVTVNALPVVSITGANPICVGSTTALSPTTGGTWASSNAAVATVTNAGVVTGVSGGTATFTFTQTSTGCTSLATPAVTVNPRPVVSITGANPICVGSTTTLSPTTGGTWTSSNTGRATVTNAGVVTGVSAGTVTFTFTETATGCTSLATPTLTVTARPVVSITGANPICVGATTTLSPTTGGTWASSNAAVATVTNAGIVTGVSGGTATFTFTLTSTGCTSLPTPAVTINPLPVVSITGGNPICPGLTTTLSPNVGGTWTSSNTAVATVTNAGVVTGVAGGTATFTFTNTTTGCVSAPTPALTVTPRPVVSITGANPICVGSTTTLSPATGGTWASSNAAVATVTNAGLVTGVSGGTATFSFILTSTGCTSLPTPTVTVNARPTVSVTGPTTICAGQTTTLSPTTGGTWASANTAVATVTNAGVVTGVASGITTFTFTETATGCTSLPTSSVTVVGLPVATIIGSNPICEGSTTTLSPISGGTWTSSNTAVATVTNAGVVTGVSGGSATFSFTQTSTGCTSLPSAPVTVTARPVVSITGANPICAGTTTTLSPTTGGTWASSNAAVATVTNAGVVTGVSGGTATFTFTETASGCSSLPTTAVTVTARPVVSITGANPICVGSTTTLSPTTGGTWASSNAAVATVTNAGVVTGVASGVASFTFTETSTGCASLPTPNITVNSRPGASISGVNPICVGSTTTLSPAAGGTWASSNAAVATVTNAGIVTGVSGGTATFSFTQTSTGCTSLPTATLTVNARPVVSITGANPICVGSTTTLSPTTGGTWVSSNAPVATVTNAGIVTGVSSGSATFTFTQTSTGCVSLATPAVTVNPLPATTITATPNPVCQNATLNLSAPAGATTYVWGGNGVVAANAATTTAVPALTGTQAYTVTITGANGCTASGTTNVTVSTLPNTTITATPNPVCQNATLNLSVPAGATTYVWGGNGIVAANAATTTAVPTLTGTQAYTVTVTGTNGCTASGTTNVTVSTLPNTTITATPSPVCQNSTLNLSAPAGATTYVWGGNGIVAANAATTTAVPTVSGTQTYTVTITGASGCTASGTINVTVNVQPVIGGSSFTNPTTCGGAQGTISLTGLAASTTYTVNYVRNGSAATPVSLTTNASGQLTITGLNAGSYTNFTVTTAAGCISTPFAGPITLVDPSGANATLTVNPDPVCQNSTLTISVAAVAGATYNWSGNGIINTNANSTTAIPTISGTQAYSVTITTLASCISNSTTNVTVNALPSTIIALTPNPVCQNSTLNLSAPAGATTYVWGGNGIVAANAATTTAVPTASGTQAYTVTITGTNGCTASGTTNVTVNTQPVVSITGANPICIGSTTTLSPTTGGTWASSNAAVAPVTNTGVVTGISGGTATFTFTNSATGCISLATPLVTVNTLPNTTITATPPVACQGQTSVSLSVPNAGIGASYSWTGAGLSANNIQVTSAIPPVLGVSAYNITVTNNNGCSASGTVNVTVNGTPNSTILLSPPSTCQNSGISLSVGNAGVGATYTWSGNGVNNINSNVTTALPTIAGPQIYAVTINDNNGCTATGTAVLTVNPQPNISGVTFTNPTTCSGAQGTIILSGLAVSNTYTVNYVRNGSAVTPVNLTSNASGQLTITGLSAGTYTNFTVTTTAGCISNTAPGPITLVDPAPPVAVIIPNNAGQICNTPTGITLLASGGVSYAWSNAINTASNALVASITDISYTVTVTDANGCSDTETILVLGFTNAACNQPPVANDDSALAVNEDDANATVNVITNDTDPQGNATIVTSSVDLDPTTPGQQTTVTNATGVFTVNASGVITFDPANNYNGTTTITYTILDNAGAISNVATVTFVVNAVNDAPVANDDVAATNEDTPVTITNIFVNDNDLIDGGTINPLSITIVTPPTNGIVVINPTTGIPTYTPNNNFTGTDQFTYQVCDNGIPLPPLCDQAVVTITVNAVNDAPIAIDDTNTTNEDTPVSGNVGLISGSVTNDNDVDIATNGQTLSYTQTGSISASQGTLVINTDGTYTFTPAADFNGTVVATYQVCDNGTPQLCDNGQLTITVNPVNDAPIAIDDVNATNEDTPVSGNVGLVGGSATNDNDVDIATNGQTLSYTQTGSIPASQGTLVINANGTYTFTPATNFNGAVVANYTVCDNGTPQLCDNGTLTITVNPVNDAPIAIDDVNATNEDTPVSGNVGLVGGSATNDNDVDIPASGQTLSYTQVGTIPASQGTLVINADGTYTFTPATNFNGTVVANYQVCDNGTPQLCDNGILTITVNAVNDAPIAIDDVNSTNEDTPVSGNVGLVGGSATNDNDVDIATNGQTLSYTQTGSIPASQGTLVINADGTYTFTPATDFNGTVVATYQVCDNGTPQLCDNGLLTITVNPVNDAPIAIDDTNTTNEDTPVSGNVGLVGGSATNDNDVDIATNGQTLSYTQTGSIPASQGTLVINADGTYTFTPAADFNGTVVATYQVCDNGTPQLCDNGVLTITVNPVNDAPVANDDVATTNEDTPVAITNIFVNDNDNTDSGTINPLSTTIVTPPTNGTVVIDPLTGIPTYTPNANFTGTDQFTYQVCDNGTPLPALCDQAIVTITVNAVNDAPVAVDDVNSTNEDTPVSGNVGLVGGSATNDNDVDIATNGQTLSYTQIGTVSAAQGTLVINADGTYTFTPATNFNGTVVATYQVCDSGTPSLCDTAILTITVNAVNDAPVAVADINNTLINTPVSGQVLTNDSDVDGDPLTTTVTTTPTNGTVVLNANGTYTYTPNTGFIGTDVFTYTVCDNGTPQLCDVTTVTIIVDIQTHFNDITVANDDNAQTFVNVPVSGQVLTNDFDPENDPLTVTSNTNPTNGTVVVNANGTFTYTPNTGYVGTDAFTYVACDPFGHCATATVNIDVIEDPNGPAVNDAPFAQDDAVATVINTPVNGNVLPNDSDPNGDALTVTSNTNPANGTVTVNANGTFTYTPNASYVGPDQFTYTVCDNGTPSACDVATVYITVYPTAPDAVDDINTGVIGTVVTGQVLTNDNGGGLPINLNTTPVSAPVNGTVVFDPSGNGSYTYTPNSLTFVGEDSFQYAICNAYNVCDTAWVVIQVTSPANNNPPVANDDQANTYSGVAVSGTLANNDFDPENGALTYNTTPVSGPTNGTIVINANGTFTYTPNAAFVGQDLVEYQVCDPDSNCATAFLTIDVVVDPNGPGNDPPFAQDDAYNTVTSTPVSGDLSPNDSEPNNDPLTYSSTPVSGPANGTVIINANGTFTYTPNEGFFGNDQFIYTVCDNGTPALCDVATAYIVVLPLAPNAELDINNTLTDVPVTGNVLTNDSDPQNLALTVTGNTTPNHGTVVVGANGDYTYTPNAGFVGSDTFSYVVCNTVGLCTTETVIINVLPNNQTGNDAPDAHNDAAQTLMDTPVNGNVSSNDIDPDADPLTVTANTNPTNGTVVVNADGTFTYTPNAGFTGLDTFSYTICDPFGLCDGAIVVIDVTIDPNGTANNPPFAQDDADAGNTNEPINGDLSSNDSDPNGDPLAYFPTPISGPNNGTVVINGNGTYTYTPNQGYHGPDQFVYVVCDGGTPSLCDTATVYLIVYPAAPQGENDLVTTLVDVPVGGNVLDNDEDPNNDPLTTTVTPLTPPVNGVLTTLNNDGTFLYTPNSGFVGVDSFQVIICNQVTLCDTTWVFINVRTIVAGNNPPLANNDAAQTLVDVPVSGQVLNNDTDPDQDILTTTVVTNPVNGTLVLNTDGTFTYTPNPGFNGTDVFTYSACDGNGACDTAVVTVTVSFDPNGPANNPPYAQSDANVTNVNTPVNGTVAANDSDPNNDPLTFSTVSGPANGTLVLNPDGTYTYTPNVGYNGPDVFTYQVCDGGTPSLCDTATVNLVVFPGAPDAQNDINNTTPNTPVTGTVATNDEDPNGLPLTFTVTTPPTNGTLVFNPNGTYTYTPNAGFGGPDTIIYVVCNNFLCDTAVLIINVHGDTYQQNDPPVAGDDNVQTHSGTPVNGDVSNNDVDPDGDPLSVNTTPVTPPTNGTLVINTNGTFTYTPNSGFNGTDTFTYVICDGGTPAACDTATVIITVTPDPNGSANDAPFAQDDANSTTQNVPVSGTVAPNDSDPNGDGLTFSPTTGPVHGTLVSNGNGTYTYTPNPGYTGPDQFTYVACDGATPNLCDTATVYLIVYPFETTTQIISDTISFGPPSTTICLPYDGELPGSIVSITDACSTSNNATFIVNSLNPPCITFTASAVGVDTFCLVLTDTFGLTDTITYTLTVIPNTDTLNVTIPAGTDSIYCIDAYTGIIQPGYDNPTVTSTLDINGINEGIITANNGVYCFTYSADNGPGNDTLVIINFNGTYYDTTYVIITHTLTAPVAVDDNGAGGQGNPITIYSLGNDTLNGNILGEPGIVIAAQNGTVIWNASENGFIYTPNDNFCGADSFTYVITNESLLSDTATVYITVACTDTLIVYNGISPNGDGRNDFLVIENIENVPNNTIYIYNRWGNLIYQTDGYSNTDPAHRFNGQWDGKDLPDGTYFYILKYVNRRGSDERINGYIIINR